MPAPTQTGVPGQAREERNEMITKLDVETSGNCKFADTWERLFPTAAEAGTMEQAGARSSLGKN